MPLLVDQNTKIEVPSAISVGVFDGVHRGHDYLISRLMEEARLRKLEPQVLTFTPHPAYVLSPGKAPRLLTPGDEKIELLSRYPLHHIIKHDFTDSFARMTGREFLKYLKDKYRVELLVLGHDHAFGSDFLRDDQTIRDIAGTLNMEMVRVKPYVYKNRIVSSSLIRQLIARKNIPQANDFLGYDYFLQGEVVHGDKRGRQLGFPTANLRVHSHKFLPPAGVYLGYSSIHFNIYKGLLNTGKRPTFRDATEQVEIHFPDFKGDLYGKKLKFYITDFLRDEIKFNHPEDLRRQIKKDLEALP